MIKTTQSSSLLLLSPLFHIQYGLRGLQHPNACTMRAIWRIYTPATRAVRRRKNFPCSVTRTLITRNICVYSIKGRSFVIHTRKVCVFLCRTDLHRACTAMHSRSETLHLAPYVILVFKNHHLAKLPQNCNALLSHLQFTRYTLFLALGNTSYSKSALQDKDIKQLFASDIIVNNLKSFTK